MGYMVKQRDRAPRRKEAVEVNEALPITCIIGAGASGLAAAKALYEAGIPFDCYEMGPVIGGVWVYNNPTGKAAAYETLQINKSCPRMAISDFPMPKHFPAYASHSQIANYFELYAKHFNFKDKITFNTEVIRVEKAQPEEDRGNGKTEKWLVTIKPKGKGKPKTLSYDAVIVANGHHWDARWPDPPLPWHFYWQANAQS